MFDSKISAYDLIEEIKDEADIAIHIDEAVYLSWLNALEQLLYSEVIKEQKATMASGSVLTPDAPIDRIEMFDLSYGFDEEPIRFEDIHAVYAIYEDRIPVQLIKSTVANGVIFDNTYYKLQDSIGVNLKERTMALKIIYFVRPALKTETTYKKETVKLPIEFIDLAKAKLRGEAYKLANEGDLAAMWLNDYNVLLENFKAWVAERQSAFGM